MIRFREFLAANCHFEINCHCQKCTVVLRNNLSFRKQTRPDTTSFFYDKKYDCRFEISRGHPIPSLEEHHLHIKGKSINLSKRKSSIISKRQAIHHFEATVLVISKRQQSSFRRDSHHHFEKNVNHHIERTGGNHFKTIVLPVINHP